MFHQIMFFSPNKIVEYNPAYYKTLLAFNIITSTSMQITMIAGFYYPYSWKFIDIA